MDAQRRRGAGEGSRAGSAAGAALAVGVALLAGAALLFEGGTARAHFRLEQPADVLVTNADGDPAGGSQKTNPCGEGQASGVVTKVHAGSSLHVRLVETVPHGGHYRVAVVAKAAPASSDLPEPAVTLAGGQCDTAAIESPPIAPVVADGLFPHAQSEAIAGKVWETDVRIPEHLGPATLQVLEFMAPHAPPCFYHHCAALDVVSADTVLDGDAGAASGRDAGAFDDPTGPQPAPASGCSAAPPATPGTRSFSAVAAALLATALRHRRRRRHH